LSGVKWRSLDRQRFQTLSLLFSKLFITEQKQ